jgi:hypothetical protein
MAKERWRLVVRLKSQKVLWDYMEFNGIKSAYELARKAGLGVGIVGHLVADPPRRETCSAKTAHALEDALGCPPGFLFEAKVSSVANEQRTRQGAT